MPWLRTVAVAVVLMACALSARADPDPLIPVTYDSDVLDVLKEFFSLVSATVSCQHWTNLWDQTSGTIYHPVFPAATGAAALLTTCQNVRASMDVTHSDFRQYGPAYQTVTTSAAAGGERTHVLVPYYFATTPAGATNGSVDAFINTGWEYLQLIPNPSQTETQPHKYLIAEVTEFFERRASAFNWTDMSAGASAASDPLQALLLTPLFGMLDPSRGACMAWANALWTTPTATLYTTEQSAPLQNVPLDFEAYCRSMRANWLPERTAMRQNGPYVSHTAGGYTHVLVPYTATLYSPNAPAGVQPMNSRVGWRALKVSGSGAAMRIARATQFLAPMNVPWPVPTFPPAATSCTDCSGRLPVGWVVALVFLVAGLTAALTAFVCRWRHAQNAGQVPLTDSVAYARMAS